MKTKLIVLLLVSALLISLCSCNQSKSHPTDSLLSDAEALSSWNPRISERKVIKDSGSMCGVLFIGNTEADRNDMKNNRKYYEELFRSSGSLEKFGFLKDIPDEQFVSTALGCDLYLIIPADPKAKVEIHQVKLDVDNDFAQTVEETLYTSEIGAPVVLRCNYSDIFSDAQVRITDSDGEELIWYPFISLRNGKVLNKTEDGKKLYDFTDYGYMDDDDDDNDDNDDNDD